MKACLHKNMPTNVYSGISQYAKGGNNPTVHQLMVEYYSTIKMTYATMWVTLGNIMLSERMPQNATYDMIPFI